MSKKVVIVYNAPGEGRYHSLGEGKAVTGILDAVAGVGKSLGELGYNVRKLPLSPPVEDAQTRVKKIRAELIFNLFEGFDEEPESEAAVAGALSRTGLPFTGCPGGAIALAQDKTKALLLLEEAGIAVPGYQILDRENLAHFSLNFPCIVKPVGEHASHGLYSESVVFERDALVKQVLRISQSYGGKALVQEFMEGRELNALVMGDEDPVVLPISEIIYTLSPGVPRILTFAAKWEEDSLYYQGTRAHCPAELSSAAENCIKEIALATFRLAGCRGYARVDVRQDREGKFRVLDINPNPDLSPTAGASLQAQVAGMKYTQFIERIVMLALTRK